MTSGLPDIMRLAAAAPHTWARLGERLRGAGFNAEYREGSQQVAIRAYEASLQRPIVIWHCRRRRDTFGSAYRMFILRDPVAEPEAVEVLGRGLLEDLTAAGALIRPEPGAVVSVLDLRVFRGLLILCDDLSHRGHAVFGAGPGTAAFCGMPSGRGAVRDALEVGCGAGAAALWLARHAERVVATDINPRALAFVKINASLNQIRNVEVREGNLFDCVAGETFDFITSQPPYVPSALGARAATYLFGGPNGDELASRVLSELPRHLSPGGRAMVVFEQPRRAGEEEPGPRAAAAGEGTRRLFVVGAEVDADAYSIRHAMPELRRGIEAFDKAATAMREHLQTVGIRGVCPAICLLESAPGCCGWTETVHAGGTLWDEVATTTIERLLAGHTLLHQPADGLQRASVRIPEGSLLARLLTPDGGAAGRIYLGLPRGYLFPSLELSEEEWELLAALHREDRPARRPMDLIAKAARVGLVDA